MLTGIDDDLLRLGVGKLLSCRSWAMTVHYVHIFASSSHALLRRYSLAFTTSIVVVATPADGGACATLRSCDVMIIDSKIFIKVYFCLLL